MRVALVEVIGFLIRELATSEDLTNEAAQTQKQINGLYNLILERMLDVSSYVRTKVLAVLSKLCDMPVKFPKQRLAKTRAAVGALEDKAAGVRKGAVQLLVKLVLTHPYGLMHGGYLKLEEWEENYRQVKAELQKVEGGMGNAVDREEGADEEGEGVKEEEAGMDVAETEEEEDDGDGDEEHGDEEAEEDDGVQAHTDDGDGESHTPGKKAKKKSKHSKEKKSGKKLKPRKSELDMTALTNEQAALAALESNQVLHLRLRKKYYVEALNFIRQVESSMNVMGQLLGSTNKAEVLEAMDFFRVAHEYQFDNAQVRRPSCFLYRLIDG
jgi:condensin complex subunit 1